MARATCLGTLVAISDGMTYGWTSPMIPYFTGPDSHIPMTSSQAEFMETINLLGSAAGLPFVLYLVNKIGRKRSMLAASFLAALCWTTLIFARNKETLYVARFFAGMAGDFCFVAAPMYVAEIAHHKIRGFLSASIYLMMLLGVLLVYTTGSYAPYYVPPIIGIILTVSQCVFFPFMPESPYFYVYVDRVDEAKEALLKLRQKKYSEEELEDIKRSVERQKTERGKPRDLVLDKSNRVALTIMTVLNLGQHYSGITIMVMNLHTILDEAGSKYIESDVAAIIFAVIMIVGGSTASVIIDRFGRKFLLIASGLSTGVILAIITVYFQLKNTGYDVSGVSWIPAVGCMVYAATFKLGLGLVPIVLTAEIFPTTIKAIGMTIAEVWYIAGAVTSVNVYSWLSNSYGIHVPFYILSVCSFGIVAFSVFYVPETKGKTLDEIQLMMRGERVERNEDGDL
ncbi:facilitated trehalose transporter Tret1-like isoform X2 [Anthonomus grandis grandis]|uniref:facilitated trehalose transporter Tret1-like isoform X2 n=1 Tax=Anthonomus grandis grandis TaxID=2921223 RepID=UPI002165FB38|nr:facilitated trehalose transporter Tret1-like isoform X2 [Anthonomus grandis grandis]